MDLGSLKKAPGSTHSDKRIGRGPGSGQGCQAGRGHKGQRSRSGSKQKAWFEGGQMPIQRRLPKFGFYQHNSKDYQVVNVADLERFDAEVEVTPELLQQNGLIKKADALVKVLGNGDLSKKLTLKVHAVSKTAQEKIEKSGGAVTLL
ncbi:MAG: 50S ribosomal protein L15 [Calditrichaeota bacterium]|nr:50S ribosomal protein L15 [Calditrichota bacterium]HQU72409.1 50S ribosomal protein L15 [Calditrichia bacterium]